MINAGYVVSKEAALILFESYSGLLLKSYKNNCMYDVQPRISQKCDDVIEKDKSETAF